MSATMTLDRQPRLRGRFMLRPLRVEDWRPLFAVAADEALWAGHPASDRWREPVFRRFFEEALASAGALVIVDPETNAIIGSSRYDFERAGKDEVEIGWSFLSRAYWGGSANGAVKAVMLRHALSAVERVIFLVGETNLRSRRAMEKIGGTMIERRIVTPLGTATVEHVVYAIDRAAFASGPLRGLVDA